MQYCVLTIFCHGQMKPRLADGSREWPQVPFDARKIAKERSIERIENSCWYCTK
jgi:hypothetical protein